MKKSRKWFVSYFVERKNQRVGVEVMIVNLKSHKRLSLSDIEKIESYIRRKKGALNVSIINFQELKKNSESNLSVLVDVYRFFKN